MLATHDTREGDDLNGESVVLVPNTAVVDMNVLSRNVKAIRVECSQVYRYVVPNKVSWSFTRRTVDGINASVEGASGLVAKKVASWVQSKDPKRKQWMSAPIAPCPSSDVRRADTVECRIIASRRPRDTKLKRGAWWKRIFSITNLLICNGGVVHASQAATMLHISQYLLYPTHARSHLEIIV